MNRVDDFTTQNQLKFKIDNNVKLMPHVLTQYKEDELRHWYDIYNNESNFKYSLTLKVGDIIKGKLIGKVNNEYLFDIGYKDYLTVPIKEKETLALVQYSVDDVVNFGTEVDILLTEVKESPFVIKGSMMAIHKQNAINELAEDEDLYIDAIVKEWNPAGFNLELDFKGETISSFMPNILAGVNKLSVEESEALVGQRITVMIESYSNEKNSFITSRKKYLQSLIPESVSELVIKDKKGNYIEFEGTVTGTTKFGVFVQINGYNDCLTGMIHANNLDTTDRENLPNIKGGDVIKFYIKDVIGTKLNLTQIIRETLWDTIEEGQIIEGVVKSHKSFGVLVQFDSETIGSIHNTELKGLSLKEGDSIKTKVITVNKANRKINLSIVK